MRKIRIAFSKSNTFIGWCIRAVQDTPYNHVFLITDENKVYQAENTGVTDDMPISDLNILFSFYKEVDEDRYQEILDYLDKQVDKEYQFLSLFRVLLKLNFPDRGDRRFICSELVARACYEELGYNSPKDALDHITPKDIFYRMQDWSQTKRQKNSMEG